MMLNKDNLNEALADAVMDRPREFYIGNRRFCLWSPSLGMSMMITRHLDALGADNTLLVKNPTMEALRLVSCKKKEICDILAIHSFRNKCQLSDSRKISERSDFFVENLDEEEVAQLLMLVLSEPKAETLISLSPLAEQRDKQALIAQIKKSSSTLTFGGTTIYGSLIAPAMEKLHIDYDKVVWGLSLVNLKMLLADNINSVFLSEEEAKKYGMATEKPKTIGMSADDFSRLKKEFVD